MTTLHKTPPLALTLRGYAESAPSLMRPHLVAAADAVAENARLRHDIDRHVGIAADLATENEKLRAERDTLLTAAVIDTTTILRRDEELQMLRAEHDAVRARLRAAESNANEYSSAVIAALHRAGKCDVKAETAIDAIAAERDAVRQELRLQQEANDMIAEERNAFEQSRDEARLLFNKEFNEANESRRRLNATITELRAERDVWKSKAEARGVDACNARAELDATRALATCGCGDEFTTHDPGTCGACMAQNDSGLRIALQKAEAERDAALADARRYRWLRGDAPAESVRYQRWILEYFDGPNGWAPLFREQLDAAIDAALKGSP